MDVIESVILRLCLCVSVRLVDHLSVLQPAFIPSRPFSGPPHIPEEDDTMRFMVVSGIVAKNVVVQKVANF